MDPITSFAAIIDALNSGLEHTPAVTRAIVTSSVKPHIEFLNAEINKLKVTNGSDNTPN